MKLSPYLSTRLAGSAFLLAGSLMLAQTTSAARNMQPRAAANGQSSGQQAIPGNTNIQQYREAEDMHTRYRAGNVQNKSTSVHSNAVNQAVADSTQRKDGSIVHSDFPKSADRNSAHATESLAPSNNAKTGENPLYEGGGKSGSNPLYESGKLQKAGASGNLSPSAETQKRKHLGNVKYGNFNLRRGNDTPGMAVNEQGSSKAPVRRRH